MTSGKPLTNKEKHFILDNRDDFPSQIAKKLGRNRKTITNYLRSHESPPR